MKVLSIFIRYSDVSGGFRISYVYSTTDVFGLSRELTKTAADDCRFSPRPYAKKMYKKRLQTGAGMVE